MLAPALARFAAEPPFYPWVIKDVAFRHPAAGVREAASPRLPCRPEGVRRLWACEAWLIEAGPDVWASLGFVLCQELDSLIRLLDITDTSQGAPCRLAPGDSRASVAGGEGGWRRTAGGARGRETTRPRKP